MYQTAGSKITRLTVKVSNTENAHEKNTDISPESNSDPLYFLKFMNGSE